MRTSTIRATALLAIAALTACSGSGTPLSPIARAPIATSSAPANTSSKTRATFVVHWPSIAQAAAAAAKRRRQTISASTQSISVTVNGGSPTVVNKPTLTGSPSTTTISIFAPPGDDGFTFTAWDQLNGTGNILDQSTVNQNILADANNTVSVALDGICAALVPTLDQTPSYLEYTNVSVPLVSGSRTVLKAARLVGPSAKTFLFTRVDADGNTVLTSAGVSPISVAESGTTPHVTISTNGTTGVTTLTPLVAEPDGVSTTISATTPDCGSGTPTFPNSFQLSTSAEIVVGDYKAGILAYDQDGVAQATLATTTGVVGLAYNSKSNSFVAIEPATSGGVTFQTLSLTGSALGSGTISPHNTGGDSYAATELPAQIVYDAASGNSYISLLAAEVTSGDSGDADGAVEEYTISGSTATYVTAQTYAAASPFALAALPNGNIAISDASAPATYLFLDSLSASFISSAGTAGLTLALAFDSTRDNIIDINEGNRSGFSGAVFDESLDSVEANFNIPQLLQAPEAASTPSPTGTPTLQPAPSATPTGFAIPRKFNAARPSAKAPYAIPASAYGASLVSAYSPGNDELYFFSYTASNNSGSDIGLVAGLAGSTVYQGGSTASNLPSGAFAGLLQPQQAVVLP